MLEDCAKPPEEDKPRLKKKPTPQEPPSNLGYTAHGRAFERLYADALRRRRDFEEMRLRAFEARMLDMQRQNLLRTSDKYGLIGADLIIQRLFRARPFLEHDIHSTTRAAELLSRERAGLSSRDGAAEPRPRSRGVTPPGSSSSSSGSTVPTAPAATKSTRPMTYQNLDDSMLFAAPNAPYSGPSHTGVFFNTRERIRCGVRGQEWALRRRARSLSPLREDSLARHTQMIKTVRRSINEEPYNPVEQLRS